MSESQEDSAFLLKVELTAGTYHIAVRAKFTTLTLGSSAMIGINCVLYRTYKPLEQQGVKILPLHGRKW